MLQRGDTAMRASPIRPLTLLAAMLIWALAPFQSAAAQDFPARPVRLVVPYANGGSGAVDGGATAVDTGTVEDGQDDLTPAAFAQAVDAALDSAGDLIASND